MRVISLLFVIASLLAAQHDPLVEGLRQFNRGEYVAAETSLEKALERQDDARARTFLALARAATGRCEAAEGALRGEFERNGEPRLRRLAGLGLVQCVLARGDTAAAFPLLRKLQKEFPGDSDVLFLAARMYRTAWNDTIREMFRRDPGSYRVNQLSAEIFELRGDYKEAISEYRKAIQKNPAAVNLHYHLGRALLMESHEPAALDAARREFELELEKNPRDAVAHYQVGQILLAQQDRAGAMRELERSISLRPDFGRALVALAKLRMEDKRTEEAISLLERAVRAEPTSEAARYGLMRAYRRAGRKEDALRQQQELEKLQAPPGGEFSDFLQRLGEKPAQPEKP